MKLISLNLGGETRSLLNSPSVPLNSRAAWDLLTPSGTTDAAEVVNPFTAMQQANVNSCVRLISESVAAIPVKLYERQGSGKVEAFSHRLHFLLGTEPNQECTASTLWGSVVQDILLHGNGYIGIQRDGAGMVQGLWYMPAQSVRPTRDKDGNLTYRVTMASQSGSFRALDPKDIIHVPGSFSFDGVTGISVIAQARHAIGGAISQDKYANRFFANSAQPSLALVSSQKIKPEDKTRMRQEWQALQSGSNQFKTAVLDQDLDIKMLSVANADSQFLESRKFSREEICGLFGLKPSQIGSESRVAGETYAAQQLAFVTDCLGPILQKIRLELTRKLLAGLPQYEIRHDLTERLKLDTKSQMDAFAVARQWGILTANECRKDLGLDPAGPECDVFWQPANMADSQKMLAPPTQKETGNTNG